MSAVFVQRERTHRLLEIITVLLLAMATLGSAWCAFQAAQWNDTEADSARVSAKARIESSRLFALATQAITYDASSVAGYAAAVVAEDENLQTFYRETLIRPEFLPIVDEWEQQIEAEGRAPANLFTDEEYLDEQLRPSREQAAIAEAAELEVAAAGENAEDYIATTLFMATGLFFAGVTSSFKSRIARLMLLAGAATTLAFGAARLVELPIA